MPVRPYAHGDTEIHLMVTSPAFAELIGAQVGVCGHLADAVDP